MIAPEGVLGGEGLTEVPKDQQFGRFPIALPSCECQRLHHGGIRIRIGGVFLSDRLHAYDQAIRPLSITDAFEIAQLQAGE